MSLPPLPLRLLPAGATVAGWELHPLKIDTFSRRTLTPLIFPLIFKTRQATGKDTIKSTAIIKVAGEGFTQEEVDDAVQTLRKRGLHPGTEDSGR